MNTIYLFLTNGFEEIEAVATIDVLKRAGLKLVTVSVEESLLVEGAHGVQIKADSLLKDHSYSDAQMLILPGGTIRLGEFEMVKQLLIEQNRQGKKIAAICAAPSILGGLSILNGKDATAYPGFEQFLTGANFADKRVVVSQNIITAKGPGCTIEFALAIVESVCGEAKKNEIAADLIAK